MVDSHVVLLQGEMEKWIRIVNSAAPKSGDTPTRSQTLPARTDEPDLDKKKKGFLTFKKK